MGKIYKIIISVIFGSLLAFAYLQWLKAETGLSNQLGMVLVFIYAVALLGGIAYHIVYRFVLPTLAGYPRMWKWYWFIFSFGFGLWLSIAIPVSYPQQYREAILRITADGSKNPLSKGSEVWISRLNLSGGSRANLEDFKNHGKWSIREGLWFCDVSCGLLEWRGRIRGPIELVFVSHPWSGIVEVAWGEEVQRLDLFDPAGSEVSIRFYPVSATITSGAKVLFHMGVGAGLGLIVLWIGVWLLSLTKHNGNESVRWLSSHRFLQYAFVIGLGLAVYWGIFYPGIMGSDVVDQWGQMLSLRINDAHPAAHTLYFWALTRLWNSPAAIALFQILTFALLVGKILSFFEARGAPPFLLWATAIMFGLNPINALNVLSLWKDTIYTACFLAILYFLLRIVDTRGGWLKAKAHVTWLSLSLLGLALFRHNGITVVIGVIFGLWVLYRSNRRSVLIVLVGVIIIMNFLKGPVYQFLGIEKGFSNKFFISYVAYYLGYLLAEYPNELSKEQKVFLDSIYPISTRWHFDKYCMNSIGFNAQIINGINDKAVKTLLQVSLVHPVRTISMILNHGALVWRIRTLDSYVWLFHEPLGENYIFPLEWGPKIEKQSLFPAWAQKIGDVLSSARVNNRINWLFFRPAIYLYFVTFIVSFAALKRQSFDVLLIYLPVFIQSVTMLFLLTCQDFRYQYPVYAVSLVVLPLALIWEVAT